MFLYQKQNRREKAVEAEIGARERVEASVPSFQLCWINSLGSRPSRFVELESVVTRGRLGPALVYFWTLSPRIVCGRRGGVRGTNSSFSSSRFVSSFDATEESSSRKTSGRKRPWAHGSMQHSRMLLPRTYSPLCVTFRASSFFEQ